MFKKDLYEKRPILEYSSTVWSPSLKYLIDDIEGVQRSFTKRLPGCGELSYEQRLQKSKLQSLEHRRLITDLITCYNIVHGHSSLEFSDFLKFSNSQIPRDHELRLDVPLARSYIRHNFFSCRVVKPWELPSSHSSQVWINKVLQKITLRCRSLHIFKNSHVSLNLNSLIISLLIISL